MLVNLFVLWDCVYYDLLMYYYLSFGNNLFKWLLGWNDCWYW